MPRAPITFEVGTTIGDWEVIGPGCMRGRSSRHSTSLCKCLCGITRYVKNTSLFKGRSKSCGHVGQFQRGQSRSKLAEGMAARNAALYHIKKGASIRGRQFLLSDEVVLSLMEQPCYWCGDTKVNAASEKGYNGGYRYNGIDRLDNDQGYVAGNVVACCGPCNRAKNVLGHDDFIAFCMKIADRHGDKLFRKVG